MKPLFLSRRQFLKIGASSLAVASAARAFDEAPPAAVTRTTTASLLTVPVYIDGKGPYRFIVDTGADRSVLATEVGSELGLLSGPKVRLNGVVQTTLADTVLIRHLAFGSKASGNFNVPTVARSLLDADGYLGLDFLDGHRVTFDFKAGQLQVGESRPKFSAQFNRPSEARINVFGTGGHLRSLECMVDGVRTAAFIDSGAEVSAANRGPLAALARRNRNFGVIGGMELIDITGGQIHGEVAMVKHIELPDLSFDDCPLVIANFQVFKAWGLTRTPALLIGMNVLRQFARVSIDYGLKELRFDLASSANFKNSNA
jgi:hypothetical protein